MCFPQSSVPSTAPLVRINMQIPAVQCWHPHQPPVHPGHATHSGSRMPPTSHCRWLCSAHALPLACMPPTPQHACAFLLRHRSRSHRKALRTAACCCCCCCWSATQRCQMLARTALERRRWRGNVGGRPQRLAGGPGAVGELNRNHRARGRTAGDRRGAQLGECPRPRGSRTVAGSARPSDSQAVVSNIAGAAAGPLHARSGANGWAQRPPWAPAGPAAAGGSVNGRGHPDQGARQRRDGPGRPRLPPPPPPLAAATTGCPCASNPRPSLISLPQGGTVVNADRQFKADVLIRDGLILRVGPDLQVRPGGGRGGGCGAPCGACLRTSQPRCWHV